MKNSKKKNWQPQKGKKTDSLNLAQNQQKRKGGIFGRQSTLIPGVYLFGRDGRHESPPCRPNITSFIFGFRFWLNVFHVLMLSDNGAEVLVYWGPDSCANDDDTGNETQTPFIYCQGIFLVCKRASTSLRVDVVSVGWSVTIGWRVNGSG